MVKYECIKIIRMPRIELNTRRLIIEDLLGGKSLRKVAITYQCSYVAAKKIFDKYNITKDVKDLPKTGRPSKTSEREKREIVRKSKKNPFWSAGYLKNECLTTNPVSVSTVRRVLHKFNLFGRKSARKPLLSKRQKLNRKRWCEQYLSWNSENWTNVIFTDEAAVQLYNTRRVLVWRPKYTRFNSQYTWKTVKFGYKTLLVWGAIKSHGKRILVRCPHRMNSQDYIQILDRDLIPFYDYDEILQQDNAPIHRSAKVLDYLGEKYINYIDDWPAQSPDINIIENMWSLFKKRLSEYRSASLDELWINCVDAWRSIPNSYVTNLYTSIPRRLKEIKKSNGSHSKY